MLRSQRLERELDRAVTQWLDWLPHWDPSVLRRTGTFCTTCPPWVDAVGLEGVPHGAVHALTTSLDALVAEHFTRCAAAWFPALALDDAWRIDLDNGAVRVTRLDGRPVHEVDLADACADLERMHAQIRQDAYVWVHRSRGSILAVLQEAVEPKIQRMTDALLAEITSPQES
jgi:hypothetical protein